MALSDWLNSTVTGNLSTGDLLTSGMDFYNTWQQAEGAKDAVNEAVKGYDKAAGTIKDLGGETKDVLGDIYTTGREDISPYLGAGSTALDQYMGLMSDPSTIMDDPAAQWRYDVGLEAVKRDLEQAGYADPMGSGARPIGIMEYGQGFASQELDRALERRLPIIGEGSGATRTGALIGNNYGQGLSRTNQFMAQNLSNIAMGKADAQMTKYMVDAMAMTNYLRGADGLLQGAAGNSGLMDLVMSALNGGTTSDGASLWGMLADSFGFDGNDQSTIDQVRQIISGGGGGDGGFGIGDLAGMLPGGDLSGTWWEGLDELANLTDWDIGQLDWIWSNTDTLQDMATELGMSDAFQEGSWFEGLDDQSLQSLFDTSVDDEGWFGNFFEDSWSALKDFGTGVLDFFS